MTNFFVQNFPLLLEKIWQQIYLAGLAILFAIVIGVPLGIWISRRHKTKLVILGFASVLQTIPSLAILALLLPILGIGVKPALVALAIYALLPIIRNTVTGLAGVSPSIIEAANGLGFTRWQKLWLVELPLSLPVILAGIRIATSMSVGIATLAAFIGAGGLGDFIYQGLALNNTSLILMGAIPAGLLALVLDYLIARFEKFIAERKYKNFGAKLKNNKFSIYIGVIVAVLLVVIVSATMVWTNQQQKMIRIGSKDFTEQFILGELMAQMIEAKTDIKVERKFNLGSTLFCHQALLSGAIDMYPEYTGTAAIVILKTASNALTEEQLYNQVKQDYADKFHLQWLAPFGFNNTNALAVNQTLAKKYHLQNISDLSLLANKLTLGVPTDFFRRPDGLIGLQNSYHLRFAQIKMMEPNLLYQAIVNKRVDVIMAFSTDGHIPQYKLVLLQDDKHLFPPYYAAPVIRDTILQNYPQIAAALAPLNNLITDQIMQQLNYQVDVENKTPAQVARMFLLQRGLIH